MHQAVNEEVVGPARRPLDGAVDGVFELFETSKKIYVAATIAPDDTIEPKNTSHAGSKSTSGDESTKPRSTLRSFAVLAGLFVSPPSLDID